MPSDETHPRISYRCVDCGREWVVDGPPIKVRTCAECGGGAIPTSGAAGEADDEGV